MPRTFSFEVHLRTILESTLIEDSTRKLADIGMHTVLNTKVGHELLKHNTSKIVNLPQEMHRIRSTFLKTNKQGLVIFVLGGLYEWMVRELYPAGNKPQTSCDMTVGGSCWGSDRYCQATADGMIWDATHHRP